MIKIPLRFVFWFNLLAFAALFIFITNGSAQDLVIGHFGDGNYGNWKMTGNAFKSGPAGTNLFAKLEIENAADNTVISSEIEGDGPTGIEQERLAPGTNEGRGTGPVGVGQRRAGAEEGDLDGHAGGPWVGSCVRRVGCRAGRARRRRVDRAPQPNTMTG